MKSLPDELLENILTYLSYPEQGRLLTVSRRWKRIIEGLPPSTRSVKTDRIFEHLRDMSMERQEMLDDGDDGEEFKLLQSYIEILGNI